MLRDDGARSGLVGGGNGWAVCVCVCVLSAVWCLASSSGEAAAPKSAACANTHTHTPPIHSLPQPAPTESVVWFLGGGGTVVRGAAHLAHTKLTPTPPTTTPTLGGIWQQRPQVTKQQLRVFLAASPAVWKLVVGHHPIASFGQHCKYGMRGDCEQMAWLEPELQVGLAVWVGLVWSGCVAGAVCSSVTGLVLDGKHRAD
jgi:hypothetical protein